MLENNPLVTVICSCYNHEKYVYNTLNSLLNQSYSPIQLIIVDDFSMDNSKKVIQKWLDNQKNDGIIFIKNQKNLGLNRSFNQAFKQAKGKYIMDLAADDVLFTDGITKLIHQFKNTKYKNCGIVFGNTKFFDVEQKFIRDYLPQDKKPPTGLIVEDFQADSFEFCSVSALYKREVYETLNGYDENLPFEDLDFWLRATRYFEVDYTSNFIINRISTPYSLESHFFRPLKLKTFKMNYAIYRIMEKTFEENKSNTKLNQALLKRIKNYRLRLKYNFLQKILFLFLEKKIENSI